VVTLDGGPMVLAGGCNIFSVVGVGRIEGNPIEYECGVSIVSRHFRSPQPAQGAITTQTKEPAPAFAAVGKEGLVCATRPQPQPTLGTTTSKVRFG
jgi:hypothetical protein